MPKTQRAFFVRRWLSIEAGEGPSPVQAACWLDIKSHYMEMRSVLRRVYCCAIGTEAYAPVLQRLGFTLLGGDHVVEMDGYRFQTALLDFGPGLIPGWLSRLAGMELGIQNADSIALAGRELIVNGKHVPLSPLDYGVIAYLYAHENEPVSRTELLDAVWGCDYEGGSNVVDVKIRTLRAKMGEYAAQIETVTGYGYRFRHP